MNVSHRLSRRRLLAGGAAAVTSAVAGCLGSGGGNGTVTADPEDLLARPVRGDPDAAVSVAAYEDFACPHCKDFNLERLPPIIEEYVEPGHVNYKHYDFPIPVDQTHSWKAAIAARAVQAEASMDEFWPYVHALFENQGSLSLDTYESLAEEVGVDSDAVRTAAKDETYRPTVKADRQDGIDNGIQATPTVLVDGEVVTDGNGNATSTTSAIRDAIEDALSDVTTTAAPTETTAGGTTTDGTAGDTTTT